MNDWINYGGERDKKYHDIELVTGEIILECYPNSYSWHEMATGRTFKDEQVKRIRLSVKTNGLWKWEL